MNDAERNMILTHAAQRSVNRLEKLRSLKAPAIIIENERRLAISHLTEMTVDPEVKEICDQFETWKKEE